jgi:hypothetical protein
VNEELPNLGGKDWEIIESSCFFPPAHFKSGFAAWPWLVIISDGRRKYSQFI